MDTFRCFPSRFCHEFMKLVAPSRPYSGVPSLVNRWDF
jgi:hypothetical protein